MAEDHRTQASPTHAGQRPRGGKPETDVQRAERDRLAPQQVTGLGSGTTLVADAVDNAEEIAIEDLLKHSKATVVECPVRVYEEYPAPGAPNRTIRQLLFHKGQMVPIAKLQAHLDAQKERRAAQKEQQASKE